MAGFNGAPQVQQQQVQPPPLTFEQQTQNNQVGRGKWINVAIICFCVLVLCVATYFLLGASVSAVTSLGGLVWIFKGATVG